MNSLWNQLHPPTPPLRSVTSNPLEKKIVLTTRFKLLYTSNQRSRESGLRSLQRDSGDITGSMETQFSDKTAEIFLKTLTNMLLKSKQMKTIIKADIVKEDQSTAESMK